MNYTLELPDIKESLNLLELILNNADVGLLFCDSNGVIRYMNRTYEELLGVKRNEAIQKHITKLIPNSRLPIVIKTGMPEYGCKYNFKNKHTLIINRIPVKIGNVVRGAISQCIFKDESGLLDLVDKLHLLEKKVKSYKKELDNLHITKYNLEDIKGNSEPILRIKELAMHYAATDGSILVVGATGTGKELFVHSIHNLSNRSGGPFVCLDCSCIPKELIESELFGYVPGAFTGAHHTVKIGKVELADGGTLFLDEIGNLPLSAQAKLLRVIEEKRMEKVGGVYLFEVNFRLVTATNKDLTLLIKKREFREDLYYRLGAMTLFVPQLKERIQDIPLLVNYFIKKSGGDNIKISDRAINMLMSYR